MRNVNSYFADHITISVSKLSHTPGVHHTEFDSHTDSLVVGNNYLILHSTGEIVNVVPFTDGVGTCPNVPIVTAALAYDYAITGKTLVLIIHNALYIENMNQNLVPPIMLLLYGIQVNECPKFLSMNPSESCHSILFPNNLSIPLLLHGSISYIPSRRPTMVECDNLLNIKLNSEYPIWDLYFSSFASQESNMVKHDGSIISIPPAKRAVYSLM